MKMNRQTGDWFLVILLFLYVGRHLCQPEHHPYCQTSCAGIRLKVARINCLLNCDQELTGVFYRMGRGVYPYISLVPATFTGDVITDERDDLNGMGDVFETPVNEVLVREPRDRSTFVRIGKRDVSAVLNPGGEKRRDEFVRIGKGAKHRSPPFLHSRSYTVQGRVPSERTVNGYEEARAARPAADETLLIPIGDAIKRPSAFVRIGKRDKDDVDNGDARAGSLADVYGKSIAPVFVRTHPDENGRSAEGFPGPDETEELEKKASAFVRIGRRVAAFVRIGKNDPKIT